MKLRSFPNQRSGFTLTEVLVSSVLIVAIMALMLTTVDQTSRTINSTTGRVAQFQSARIAFDAMTRNLSQATLNTYWDYDRDLNKNPLRFRRQADLHFISGRASGVDAGTNRPAPFFGGKASLGNETENYYPGHAVFFQAPIGFTASEVGNGNAATRRYSSLSNLLANVGYYVKWDEDHSLPEFTKADENMVAERWRYRLMEVLQPGETNMVFNNINYTEISNLSSLTKSPYLFSTDWIQVALGRKDLPPPIVANYVSGQPTGPNQGNKKRMDYSRPLAENIVALIIMPKRAAHDRDNEDRWDDLTQNFEYDTRPAEAFAQQAREVPPSAGDVVTALKARDYRLARQMHQLPPVVQVTMIAIDEPSAVKLQDWVVNTNSNIPPEWTKDLFKKVTTPENFTRELGDPVDLDSESLVYKIANADRRLPHPPMTYRVFTTDVVLRAAKWSKDN